MGRAHGGPARPLTPGLEAADLRRRLSLAAVAATVRQDGLTRSGSGQRFCQLGARFSAKARGPSVASSLLKTSPEISDSIR